MCIATTAAQLNYVLGGRVSERQARRHHVVFAQSATNNLRLLFIDLFVAATLVGLFPQVCIESIYYIYIGV